MPDFTIKRGNDDDIDLTITKADGSPADLSNADIVFGAKRHADFNAYLIRKTNAQGGGITVTDAPGGLATVHFSPGDTSDFPAEIVLPYEVQTDNDGDRDTPLSGKLTITADIVR